MRAVSRETGIVPDAPLVLKAVSDVHSLYSLPLILYTSITQDCYFSGQSCLCTRVILTFVPEYLIWTLSLSNSISSLIRVLSFPSWSLLPLPTNPTRRKSPNWPSSSCCFKYEKETDLTYQPLSSLLSFWQSEAILVCAVNRWTFSSSNSYISIGERELMWLDLFIFSILTTTAALFIDPLWYCSSFCPQGEQRQKMVQLPWMNYCINLVILCLLLIDAPWWALIQLSETHTLYDHKPIELPVSETPILLLLCSPKLVKTFAIALESYFSQFFSPYILITLSKCQQTNDQCSSHLFS